MISNSILLQSLNPEQFKDLITGIIKTELEDLKKELSTKSSNDDLMSRKQVLELLKIDASTLYRYQNSGKIPVHKFANRCYYKRSELMQCLIPLKH